MRSKKVLSKNQLAEIGSIAVESTYCEQLVGSLIWSLARLNELNGKFFTYGMQMGTRIDLLSSLGKLNLVSASEIETFTNIISELKENNEKRNIVIHGYWSAFFFLRDIGNPNAAPTVKALKQRRNSNPQEFSAKDLEKIAENICVTTEKLQKFSVSVWSNLP